MHIGFDAKRAFFNHSGLGNYSRFIVNSLAEFCKHNTYFLFTPKIKNQINFIQDYTNIEVVAPQKALHRKFPSFWRSFAMANDFLQYDIDIFHGLSGELPENIASSGVKSVVTIHDLIFMRYPELYKPIDRKIYERKFRFACNAADKIIAISEQTKKDIIDFLGADKQKIEVIYQSCDERFQGETSLAFNNQVRKTHGLPDDYLLYVGTIEKRKNLLSIIKAIHLAEIKKPLVVVGRKTPYFKEVETFIASKSVQNVFFLNNVTNEQLPAIYQMASVFIYPSVFEGFGIPILEALYSKTPVITSKGSCFPEAGGPSSIYIDPEKPEEIASGIKQVTNNTKLRHNMIVDGYKHAQKFNHPHLADQMNKIYTQLYNEK